MCPHNPSWGILFSTLLKQNPFYFRITYLTVRKVGHERNNGIVLKGLNKGYNPTVPCDVNLQYFCSWNFRM